MPASRPIRSQAAAVFALAISRNILLLEFKPVQGRAIVSAIEIRQ